MMDSYNVTVLIRTRNRHREVIQAIESVYNQTLRPSIQCLVINDASSDNTREVIEEWVSRHSDFRLDLVNLSTNVKNGGALIAAKDHILGKYIIVLDDDDRYINDKALEVLYSQCKEEDLDVLFPSDHNDINCYCYRIMYRSELFKQCPISRVHYTEDHYTWWFHDMSFRRAFYRLDSFIFIKPSDTNYFDQDYYEDFKLHGIFEELFYRSPHTQAQLEKLYKRFDQIDYPKLSDHIKETWDEIDQELSKLNQVRKS